MDEADALFEMLQPAEEKSHVTRFLSDSLSLVCDQMTGKTVELKHTIYEPDYRVREKETLDGNFFSEDLCV